MSKGPERGAVARYLDNPAIIDRASKADIGQPKGDAVFPIGSVSKTFCGALCALMAADGKFGGNGLNASLKSVLEYAKTQNPKPEIDDYLQMLERKDLGDVTISQLLTHTSRLKDNYDVPNGSYLNRQFEFFSDKLTKEEFEPGQKDRYSNEGFDLIEAIVNLVSTRENGYRQELQERVLNKAAMRNTLPISESAEGKAHVGSFQKIEGITFQRKVVEKTSEVISAADTATGIISLAAGGLCSSANDLNIYGKELMKLIAGQPNAFEADPEKCEAIKQMYHQSIAKNQDGLARFVSLGLDILETKDGVMIAKDGVLQTNSSMMAFEVAGSYDNFISGKVEFKDSEIKPTTLFMQQTDFLANYYLYGGLLGKKDEYLGKLFDRKLNEEEKAQFADKHPFPFQAAELLQKKEDYLISQKRLPENFPEIKKQIEANFQPELSLPNYLNENGVIDSAKISQDFPNGEAIDRVVNNSLKTAVEKSDHVLKLSGVLNEKDVVVEADSKPAAAAAVEVDEKPIVGPHTAKLAAQRGGQSQSQSNAKQ